MRELTISNYDEIKIIVDKLNVETFNQILFRGEPKSLVSSLVKCCKSDSTNLETIEKSLFEKFKQKSGIKFKLKHPIAIDWEARIAAREYGLASSLIDLSNSFDIALEFAIYNLEEKNIDNTSLWILDKSKLKQITINQNTDIKFEDITAPTIIQFSDYSGLTHHKRRLIQGGYFLKLPYEDIITTLDKNPFFSDHLIRIIIPKNTVNDIRKKISLKVDLNLDACIELDTLDLKIKQLCKKLNKEIK